MGYTLGPKGFCKGLPAFLLQINIVENVIHETDQPDAGVDFFDAHGLAGEGDTEVDLLVVQAKASAAGDDDGAVVERVMRFWDASIGSARSRVDLSRDFMARAS
jgi:hypothetical protein